MQRFTVNLAANVDFKFQNRALKNELNSILFKKTKLYIKVCRGQILPQETIINEAWLQFPQEMQQIAREELHLAQRVVLLGHSSHTELYDAMWSMLSVRERANILNVKLMEYRAIRQFAADYRNDLLWTFQVQTGLYKPTNVEEEEVLQQEFINSFMNRLSKHGKCVFELSCNLMGMKNAFYALRKEHFYLSNSNNLVSFIINSFDSNLHVPFCCLNDFLTSNKSFFFSIFNKCFY